MKFPVPQASLAVLSNAAEIIIAPSCAHVCDVRRLEMCRMNAH